MQGGYPAPDAVGVAGGVAPDAVGVAGGVWEKTKHGAGIPEYNVARPRAVTVHVYDVAHHALIIGLNSAMALLGSGAYHAAVEIEGLNEEVSFGCTDEAGTGLFIVPPKGCEAHRYRESIDMGTTSMSLRDIHKLIDTMSDEWPGMDYDLLRHNCCHFCAAILERLGAKPMPNWVLSLAGVGAGLDDHIGEKVDLGKQARGALPLDSYHMGDYTRGALVGVAIRGKQARGAPPTPSLHFTDFARGMVSKVVGGSPSANITPDTAGDLGDSASEGQGIVWIDFKGESAFGKTGLQKAPGITFKGFTADMNSADCVGPAVWITYITERAGSVKTRVAAVILNKAQLQQIVPAVKNHCREIACEPPTFILVSRSASPEEAAEFGIDPLNITSDWGKAAEKALAISKR